MRKFIVNVNGIGYEVEVEEVTGNSAAPAAPKAPAAPAAQQAPTAPAAGSKPITAPFCPSMSIAVIPSRAVRCLSCSRP